VYDKAFYPLNGLGHIRRYTAPTFQQIGKKKRQFKRLRPIQTRVTMRVIAIAKIGLGHINNTANTFGDILSCHFEMHATRIGANLIMRVKKSQ